MREDFLNDDIEDIDPVVDADSRFIDALQSLNVDEIMACWSDSDGITLIFPGIEMAKGPEAVRIAIEAITYHTSKLRAVLHPVSVMRHGDIGWSFLTGTLVTTYGDETLSIQVYVTNIFRREPGGWKILHHHSNPGPNQPTYLEQRMN